MKKYLSTICISALSFLMIGCSDFFEVDPDDTIDSDDYIAAQNEMYTGFYGILELMQGMADHAIYLTDTRANYIETTIYAPQDLKEIYTYGNISSTNEYANPSCYYALIIACNDYLHKMAEYKLKVGGALDTAEDDWKALISSAIRIKAWTYMRLGQIYGKAVYFDNAMESMENLDDTSVFERLNSMEEIANKCLTLVNNGMPGIKGLEGIDGTLVMNWADYLDPEGTTSAYDKWAYIVPDCLLLRCELQLCTGTPDYAWIKENILAYLYGIFNASRSTSIPYLLNASARSPYVKFFYNCYNSYESVCHVMYDYTLNQTNRLSNHFSSDYPNSYYLRTSAYGLSCFPEYDNRLNFDMVERNGDTIMAKYLYGVTARYSYQSDAYVQLQRGHDYHFYLAEAENNLNNWEPAATILNEGYASRFMSTVDFDTAIAHGEFDYRYRCWKCPDAGTRTYNNDGIVGFHEGDKHPYGMPLENGKIKLYRYVGINGSNAALNTLDADESVKLVVDKAIKTLDEANIPYTISDDGEIYLADEAARQKFFDLQLLDEMLLEYVGEGRAYGMMIRMARKYNDPNIIANRVCPKYPTELQEQVRARILSGHYYIDWTL